MPAESRPLIVLVRRLALDLCYGTEPSPDSFHTPVRFGAEGSAVARNALATGKPCMIARFGSSELACINYYTRWRLGRKVSLPYPRQLRHVMRVNAGVFSDDDASLDRFSTLYLETLSDADVLGVWFNRNEHHIVARYCPDAQLVQLEALNCVLHEKPWSGELAGKTVLVVHPFAKTIESQYRTRRAVLFKNNAILPEFELKTLAAVQTGAGNMTSFSTWFDALDHMRSQIAEIDFDVAVVGAGAYGLPLASMVKRMGRQAVHLGGATQLLFGIRGRRWETESPDDIAPLFNEHWVRPSEQERPENCELVEGGCYW